MTDEFDQHLVSSLRDVTPADDDIRELHISIALAEIRRPAARPLTRVLGVAAAMVLIVGGVATFRAGRAPGGIGVSAAEHLDTTVPAKSGADTSMTTDEPRQQVACSSSLVNSRMVGEYGVGTDRRRVDLNSDSIEVLDTRTCASLAVFELPTLPRSQTVCIPSLVPGTELVGSYETTAIRVIVLATEKELTVLGGPECEVIARFPRPPTK